MRGSRQLEERMGCAGDTPAETVYYQSREAAYLVYNNTDVVVDTYAKSWTTRN